MYSGISTSRKIYHEAEFYFEFLNRPLNPVQKEFKIGRHCGVFFSFLAWHNNSNVYMHNSVLVVLFLNNYCKSSSILKKAAYKAA